MEFRNDFVVDGRPSEVIAVFADTPLVASFLPGASVGEPRDDGSYPGQLVVSFGPKRLTFKGSIRNEVDAASWSGRLSGQASADVRGAKMAVDLAYALREEGTRTRVETVAQAELAGMLAEFARTGGTVLTQALLEEFAQRFSLHMRAQRPGLVDGSVDGAVEDSSVGSADQGRTGKGSALSGWGLIWRMLRSLVGGRAAGR